MNKIKDAVKIIIIAAKRFYTEQFASHASALAYETLLSLVPVVSVVFYAMHFFSLFSEYLLLAQAYVYANFVPSSGELVQKYLDQFIFQTNKLPLISILLFAVTGLMIIFTIINAFNDIWRIQKSNKNMLTIFISAVLLFIMPLVLGFSVLVTSYLSSFTLLSPVSAYIIMVVYIIINACMLSLLYIVVPDKPIRWRDGFAAGFLAAILFDIFKTLFVLYVNHLAQYTVIYGAFAIIPTFLIWIYISWSIVLYAGLIIQARNDLRDKK